MLYIGFDRVKARVPNPSYRRIFKAMTYLEVVFNIGGLPGEAELRAVDAMREVYGILRVQFNGKERTVRVRYDASRMKQDAVAKMLRQAGIDVREAVALA